MNSIIAEKTWISNRLGVPYENLSQSYIRAETALTTQSSIPFVLQSNKKQTTLASERLLGLTDEFVITHMTVALKQIGADSPTAAQQVGARLYTWENPTIFSGTNAANVGSIYNGNINWIIDRKQFVPNFPVRAFRRVPTTQTGTDIGYTSSGQDTFDGFDNGLYGFYPTEPTKINGKQTIDLEIDLGTSVAFDDSSNSVYAVCELRGYLIVNAG